MEVEPMNESDYVDDPCYYNPPFITERFWLVGIVGTSVAIVSFVENAFLFFMLMKRRSHRASQNLYLGLLAFFDMFMAGAYIPLMSLNLFADYFQSLPLLTAWYYYMTPMITVSHIAMTSSSFLIVAATVERYAITVKPQYTKFLSRHRVAIAVFTVLFGFLTKLTMALEIEWDFDQKCAGKMTQWTIYVSEFAQNVMYATYWKILFRNIVTILLPFFLLLSLNVRIIFAYKKTDFHYLNVQKLSEAKRKQRVRAATRTLLLVVFTYLLSNFLNVIVTLWEYFAIDQLQTDFGVFYIFSVDVVSLLTIIAGALRLPIYVSCQKQLRKEFAVQLKRCLLFANHWGYNHSKFGQSETMKTQSTDDLELGDGDGDGDGVEGEGEETGGRGQYAHLLMALGTALLHQNQEEKKCFSQPQTPMGDSSILDSPLRERKFGPNFENRLIRLSSLDDHYSHDEEMV